MALSSQHRAWLNRGGNWRLCGAGVLVRDRLRTAGYTVYDLGNDDHLNHQPPEDHCPYSATGWPGRSPDGVVMAIDIMPPPAGRGLPSLQVLGARLVADKRSGRFPPIKYMNWGPVDDEHAVQYSWEPAERHGPSSDTGHIHISFRTDLADWAGAYDPLGDDMADVDSIIKALQGFHEVAPGVTVELNNWISDFQKGQADMKAALARVEAKLAAAPAPPAVDVAALALALANQLPAVTVEQVQAALNSDEGQAALVRAADTAKNS